MTSLKTETILCHSGRPDKDFINPPVTRAATILFDSVEHMHSVEDHRFDGQKLYYGRYGTTSTQMLADSLAQLESCDRAILYPSGVAAISGALCAITKSGDHILMTEGVYPNARRFCDEQLSKFNVETSYYDTTIAEDIEKLIRPNTRVIYMESPASSTMELQNISAILAIAKKHKLITVIDNTWATALRFKPLELGIDLSIQSATKHISGHSDLVMGVVTGNGDLIDAVGRQAIVMGYCISADDAYLALRGLRSMKIRMDHAEKSARIIARFLKSRAEVIAVLHPEFDVIKATNFKTYFSGGNGVFSFVIDPKFPAKSVHHFINGMKLFGLGFSWGGFESLIVPQSPNRQHNRNPSGSIVRLSIGFEDTDDLIHDLAAGLDRLHEIK